ncbi:MAG TPA: pyridoxal phosphate-dependent aminotransferase [Marinilabiliaceae bacterium]|nr:pyridoxal phosphate-dependent aminotransferase [Marinilabiliaceae bacterium]
MTFISHRIEKIMEPEMALMSLRSKEMENRGLDVINLSLGEPDFSTPDYIKEAGVSAIRQNFSHYPPIQGYVELRKAISEKLKRENGLTFSPEQIVVSNGAKQALANVLFSVVNPGDEVIIPTPYWATYIEMVKMVEGVSVLVRTSLESQFKMSASQLEAVISHKTKVVLINSPSNPSGAVYSKEELMELVAVLQRYPDIIVLSDEIYELITYTENHQSIASLPGMKGRVAIVNGVSKGFAMTGWRIGFSASSQEIAEACVKVQSQYTSGACSIAQMAALAAYTHPLDESMAMQKAFKMRRDLVVKMAQTIPNLKIMEPEGAFYLFPDVSSYFGCEWEGKVIETATDLSMFLLHKAMVATVTGEAFGEPLCIRISYALSDDRLKEAMIRIKDALALLK